MDLRALCFRGKQQQTTNNKQRQRQQQQQHQQQQQQQQQSSSRAAAAATATTTTKLHGCGFNPKKNIIGDASVLQMTSDLRLCGCLKFNQ
jgi:hypothetical protein